MWKRHFQLIADAPPQSVIEAVSTLLTKRSVKHSIEENCIISSDIPIPIVNWDRRRYSRDNFIGVNPFLFVDSVALDVTPEPEERAKLVLTAIQGRSYIPVVFILLMSGLVWTSGESIGGWIFLGVAVLYYLFAFHVVIGKLLPGEIKRALQPIAAVGRG